MNILCGDDVGEGGMGQMRRCMGCVNEICCGEGGVGEGDANIDVEDGEEDGAVDLVDGCREDVNGEDVMRLVPMLEDEEDEGVVNLLVINKSDGSILARRYRCVLLP